MTDPIELTTLHLPSAPPKRTTDLPLLVAISTAKNEGDIIGAWTSHVCSIFDAIYIVDHMSSDGTREFLVETARERGNFHIYAFDIQGFFQEEITNHLAGIAASLYPDAWLFPLDADEFLHVTDRFDLLERVRSAANDRLLRMHWRSCVPLSLTGDEDFGFNSPCLISPYRGIYKKVAVHSSAIAGKGWRFRQGNHQVLDIMGRPLGNEVEADLADLIHIPIRSLDHFALKCVQGSLAYNALPPERKSETQGVHWRRMIARVIEEGKAAPDVLRGFIAYYGQPDLFSKEGVTIYGLIDNGWECAPVKVAHVEPWLKVRRRRHFLELADEVLSRENGAHLERFLRAARKQIESQPADPNALLPTFANQATFSSLSELRPAGAEAKTDIEVLGSFVPKAFSRHEHPVPSTWESHVPFLFCLLHCAKPRRFVELGTHNGNCFFAACQASRELDWAIECIAIDMWQGDAHTGFYGEDVFREFDLTLNRGYQACGKYIRKAFDEASHQFAGGSIDLLHIDGLHIYEAVSRDFETWLPKMSDRGIVMLHDTQEHEKDFGVWRLWSELQRQYPSIEFEHGHGLGVLLVGSNPSPSVRSLFGLFAKQQYAELLRILFSNLGGLSPIKGNP